MAIDFTDSEGDEIEAGPSMNTTPLIDVLLVLLVMLIITIPVQLNAVRMDLPAGIPPEGSAQPQVVRLEITQARAISWNGEVVNDRMDLEARLAAAARWPEQPEIHLHADAKTPYDTVASVLTAAQNLGLQKIGVVGLDEYASPAAGAP